MVLYCIWLPLTCLGRLEHIEAEREFFALVNHGSSPDRVSSFLSDSFDIALSDDDSDAGEKEERDDSEGKEKLKQNELTDGTIGETLPVIDFSEET